MSGRRHPAARWLRAALFGISLLALVAVGLRLAVRHVPWFGPWAAETLRSIVGAEAVTFLEELSAKLEDLYHRATPAKATPRSLEQARPASAPELIPEQGRVQVPKATARFTPRDVGAMDSRVAARDDGRWQALTDPFRPDAVPVLFATLLHPDRKRPWAEVFVVSMAASQVQLHAVAGTIEPEATTSAGHGYRRQGLIPREHVPSLLAAFNGGFMTKHGRHGMHVDGVTLVGPRAHLCTLLSVADSGLFIGTWSALEARVQSAEREGRLSFWRQAAPCMYEHDRLNARLQDEKVRNWGATLDGNVVIRRSAVGLDSTRTVLFVGISNDTTARAMADAMHHAGASDVAQLDVNWSYPKFLLFPPDGSGGRRAQGVFEGFQFRPDEYVKRPSQRDFFYLVRREVP